MQQATADVFAQAISTVFLVAVPFAVVAPSLVSLLEEKPLRETVHVAGGGPQRTSPSPSRRSSATI